MRQGLLKGLISLLTLCHWQCALRPVTCHKTNVAYQPTEEQWRWCAALAVVCHRHDALLIVDEAHGAHFAFDDRFPQVLPCSSKSRFHRHERSASSSRGRGHMSCLEPSASYLPKFRDGIDDLLLLMGLCPGASVCMRTELCMPGYQKIPTFCKLYALQMTVGCCAQSASAGSGGAEHADITIQSTHKMLSALTQANILQAVCPTVDGRLLCAVCKRGQRRRRARRHNDPVHPQDAVGPDASQHAARARGARGGPGRPYLPSPSGPAGAALFPCCVRSTSIA